MREEIIKMARSSGFSIYDGVLTGGVRDLMDFFHMAQAAMIEQGWRKCAEGQKTTQFCGMTEKAVLAEREACENLCDDLWQEDGTAYDCREAIKARNNS